MPPGYPLALGGAGATGEQPQHPGEAGRPGDDRVALVPEPLRRLLRGDADAQRGGQPAAGALPAQRGERVEVGEVVAAEQRPGRAGALDQRGGDGSLVDARSRAQLEHLAAGVRMEAGRRGLGAELERAGLGRRLVGRAAPVERLNRALVLDPKPELGELERRQLADECPRRAGGVADRRVVADRALARLEQLEAVVAGVGDLLDADDHPRLERRPAADAGDEAVAPPDVAQRLAGRLGDRGVGRVGDDRGEGAVDVAEDGRLGGTLADRLDQPREDMGGGGVHEIGRRRRITAVVSPAWPPTEC